MITATKLKSQPQEAEGYGAGACDRVRTVNEDELRAKGKAFQAVGIACAKSLWQRSLVPQRKTRRIPPQFASCTSFSWDTFFPA